MSSESNTHRRDLLKAGAVAAAGMAMSPLSAEAADTGLVFPIASVTLPVVGSSQRFPVRRIYCVGRNYLAHIRELGNDEREAPFFFAKQRDMIVQNGEKVNYPSLTNDYQHELELVVAMKSGGENIKKEDALSHIYGYAVGLDLTRRDLQGEAKKSGRPWDFGKGFAQSAPISEIHRAADVTLKESPDCAIRALRDHGVSGEPPSSAGGKAMGRIRGNPHCCCAFRKAI
jgi:2-keto-4-pentenoate hydratase/2-oxohepta-3-ene-1,7-dioic acid hydratase in catechol pathway